MDPKRLEEIRRKLRQGEPARVINGQVVVEGVPGAKPAPPTSTGAAGGAPQPQAQGVEVKQHEWGTAQAWETPRGEARILTEQALLDRNYPGFALQIDDDGTPFAHGTIGPNDSLRTGYRVLVEIPPGYGHGVMPRAYVLEPPLRAGAPHRFNDGSLCLDHSGAFTAKSTLITFLSWVSVWLCLYEGWAETGQAW